MTMAAIAVVVSVGAGVAGTVMNKQHADKMADAQAALGKEQSDKLRRDAVSAGMASKNEIETLRQLRSMDAPAFRQASETALLQAKKGAERMARHVTMSRQPDEVNAAIFGDQFQQYVGLENQKLQQYAGLTQQILQATQAQQQNALQTSGQAVSLETGTRSKGLDMQAAGGSLGGSLLGAVGSAAASFAQAQGAKDKAASNLESATASEDKWIDLYSEKNKLGKWGSE
jgi:hypothetical protein